MNKENYFARMNAQGNFDLLHKTGERVIQIPVTITPVVWPVGSDLSGYYEHPEGIVLTKEDVEKLGVEIEDEKVSVVEAVERNREEEETMIRVRCPYCGKYILDYCPDWDIPGKTEIRKCKKCKNPYLLDMDGKTIRTSKLDWIVERNRQRAIIICHLNKGKRFKPQSNSLRKRGSFRYLNPATVDLISATIMAETTTNGTIL